MSDVVSLAENLDAAIARAVGALRAGELVVLPTDTVYGLAADAFNKEATARIFELKQRPRALALPVLVSRPKQAWALCSNVPNTAMLLAAVYWPGALTMVLPQMPDMAWDLGEGGGGVAVRMPAHDDLLAILEQTGPLAVTSANHTGDPTPRAIEEIRAVLGDTIGVYLDGGASKLDTGSTIVDLTGAQPRVLREGIITIADIERTTGMTVVRV